jgi:hypothetical protein
MMKDRDQHPTNYIAQNVNQAEHFPETHAAHLRDFQALAHSRHLTATLKKEEDTDFSHKLNQFGIIRWSVLRRTREDMTEAALERMRIRSVVEEWARILRFVQSVKQMYFAFKAKKLQLVFEELKMNKIRQI